MRGIRRGRCPCEGVGSRLLVDGPLIEPFFTTGVLAAPIPAAAEVIEV